MIPYSLHVALLLTACWLFYKLLLQNETYYHLNRVLLWACIALAFTLPLVPVPQQYSMRNVANIAQQKITTGQTDRVVAAQKTITATTTASETAPAAATTPATTNFNLRSIVQWAFWLYWSGVIAFGANFILQIVVLVYQAYRKPAIRDGQYRIVELDGDKAPCSFGNNIFINPAKYDWETYNQILTHEKVHIQQGHSLDLIIAELMLIMQWFNPFAWLYRKEIESNMEFLTDDAVLQSHKVTAEDYQLSLLKVSVPNYAMRITTNYNQSLLKRRIMMMNTKRSNIQSMWKYFMLMPFMAIMLCGFNEPVDTSIKPLAAAARKIGRTISTTLTPDTTKTKKETVKIVAPAKQRAAQTQVIAASLVKANILTTQDIQALDDAGISAAYIKSFVDIGYKDVSLATLTGFDNAGITAAYVKSFMDLGYDVKPATIHAFDNSGIAASYVKSFMDIKYPNMMVATILAFDNAGIAAAYVKSLTDAGFKDVSVANVLAFDNQGISADFIKSFKNIGYKDLSVATLMAFDNNGLSAAYVKGFKDIGYQDLSAATLLAFDDNGLSASYVKGFKDMGYDDLSPATLLAFDNNGLSASYVKGFKEIGYKDLSPATLLAFDNNGLSSDFVKSLMDIGYKDLRPATLLSFDNAGITAKYIKSFMDIGYKDLSPTFIISNNNKGATAEGVKAGAKKN